MTENFRTNRAFFIEKPKNWAQYRGLKEKIGDFNRRAISERRGKTLNIWPIVQIFDKKIGQNAQFYPAEEQRAGQAAENDEKQRIAEHKGKFCVNIKLNDDCPETGKTTI